MISTTRASWRRCGFVNAGLRNAKNTKIRILGIDDDIFCRIILKFPARNLLSNQRLLDGNLMNEMVYLAQRVRRKNNIWENETKDYTTDVFIDEANLADWSGHLVTVNSPLYFFFAIEVVDILSRETYGLLNVVNSPHAKQVVQTTVTRRASHSLSSVTRKQGAGNEWGHETRLLFVHVSYLVLLLNVFFVFQ